MNKIKNKGRYGFASFLIILNLVSTNFIPNIAGAAFLDDNPKYYDIPNFYDLDTGTYYKTKNHSDELDNDMYDNRESWGGGGGGMALSNNGGYKKQTWGGKALRILGSFFAVDENKTFFGKIFQFISHFTWELPQQVLGVVTAEITNLLGGIRSVHYQNGALILENKFISGGFALGNLINTGDICDGKIISHEYGHYIQSRKFGPAYLFAFAIPSAIRYVFLPWGSDYENFYTERSATSFGETYLDPIVVGCS